MDNFILSLSNSNKKVFFKIKNTIIKIVKATSAVDFNLNCLRENLCPKSINSRRTGNSKNTNNILKKRLQDAKNRLQQAKEDREALWTTFSPESEDHSQTAYNLLEEYQEQQLWIANTKTQKKLTTLHRGPVRNERPAQGFINLSSTTLSKAQEKLLNLGLNCHYIRKPHPESKRIETECLIDQLLTLQSEDKVTLSPTLREELIGEAGRDRGNFRSQVLTKELKDAAKELRENNDIIIRRGDKAAVYVILDKNTYLEKMDGILNNPAKFQRLQKDPTETLKKRINSLIQKANTSTQYFSKVIGDYGPGYCYGTIKTHKAGNPLRPIISQVTTPTYQVAKKLNSLLTPYAPLGRSVTSATEFIDLLRTAPPCNDIASLDVESLFTNVPVDETINIILNRVYRSDQPKLDIQESTLRAMLETCTKEAPFLSHRGDLFRQIDGVAMGSPLGVLFANMYMAHVEEQTFKHNPSPGMYARYIDDIFITTTSEDEVNHLIMAFQTNSCLKFTSENSVDGRLPFLDINIIKEGRNFKTSVYTKATNVGRCLNARGECPATYKKSVVAAYVNRALTHCSSWTDTHRELDRIRQLLTNNGYQDHLIEETIKKKMDKFYNKTPPATTRQKITIYHQNHFHNQYREECNAIKSIIKRGVTPTNEDTDIDLRIYCRPSLTKSLVMRNSTAPRAPRESTTNVVYKFSCMEGHCDGSKTYIGRTSSTLRRRLQFHRNNGSIFQHYTDSHNMKPPLQTLIEQTKIVHHEQNFRKLQIAEAVSITCQHPSINIQQAAEFILPSARPQPLDLQQRERAPIHNTVNHHQSNINPRPGPTTRATTRAAAMQLTANENSAPSARPATPQAPQSANENSAPSARPATPQAHQSANENSAPYSEHRPKGYINPPH